MVAYCARVMVASGWNSVSFIPLMISRAASASMAALSALPWISPKVIPGFVTGLGCTSGSFPARPVPCAAAEPSSDTLTASPMR